MLRHGWRTGAIIPELEREIRIINTEQYMHSLTWQQALTGLLERMQVGTTRGEEEVLAGKLEVGLHLLDACSPNPHTHTHTLRFPRLIRMQSHDRCWLPG